MKPDETNLQTIKLELNLVELNRLDKQSGLFTFTYKNKVIGEMTLYWQTPENIFFKISSVPSKTYQKKQLSEMIYLSMCYVFDELNVHKLSCELISDNSDTIDTYFSQGFEQEGIFKQHLLKDAKYYHVHRLSCFKNNFTKYLKSYSHKVLNGQRFAINVGDKYIEETTISNDDIVKYSDVSGDNNPLHMDSSLAINNGFKANIVHGMLSASIFSKILGTKFPGNGSIYISQNLKFVQPIYPDEKITITLKVLSIIGTKYIISTQITKEGSIALEGVAKVIKS